MKNITKRLFAFVLCLAMVLTMVPAVFAAEELFDLSGSTMTLGNTLEINFAIDTANLEGADNYAVIAKEYADERGTVTKTIPQAEWKVLSGSKYYVSYAVSAKEMNDTLTTVVYNAAGEAVSNAYTDSVAGYCVRMLNKEAEKAEPSEEKMALFVDMVNYGAAAQTEWSYNVENLANAGLTEEQKALATETGELENILEKGTGYAGSTLSLKENLLLNVFYKNEIIDQAAYALVSFTDHYGNAESATVTEFVALGQDLKYVPIDAIAVADGSQAVKVELYNEADEVISTTVESIESYVARNPKSLHSAVMAFCAGAYNYFHDEEAPELGENIIEISANVSVENGQVAEDASIGEESVNAQVPAGVQVDGETLTLTVAEKSASDSGIEAAEGEELLAMDIHIAGVSKENTTAIQVFLGQILPQGLNIGNVKLYHEAEEMTQVMTLAELDAHNEFYYDPATGDITVSVASFSEFAVISTASKWEGNRDYSWYDAEAKELQIANADQLAAFGAIVGGMDGQAADSFAGKTVKLIVDIDLNDAEEANSDKIFYPIGYHYTADKNGDGTTGDHYSTVYAFEGTFDGNGHTISNFYQNTWEIKGDYDGNYYNDAMGLFSYVYGGTIKNLTVDNFSSDGEFAPTGVIAAYAVNSNFQNIAITNCNPRVYNTGNGGIVGIGGLNDDPDTFALTFENITIDNSNKITALWGSWDVACGGLVGMFRGAGHAYMTNCHVAAQIDVYNDVCGNYQYYWYRYAGMMIGTNKNMITDEAGYTVPETDKFHAEDCTVHFGEWNDYYYCELVANSLASYTHDHQFSRLTQIQNVSEIQDENGNWNTTGNFIVMDGKTPTDTCYHIMKDASGNLYEHKHEDEGTEVVNGETVLKENNQRIYLPFNQLFTGYGWGVKHIPVYNGEDYAFEGITILDRDVADSVEKFEAVAENSTYITDTTVTIGELFKAVDAEVAIDADNVQVFVSPVGEDSTAGGTYVADIENWTNGTLTFSGTGAATITITDYNFCIPTTIDVEIIDLQPVEKFETKFTGDFLYRVGNQNAVALGSLFKAKDGAKIGNVSVTVETITGATGTYTSNATWTNGTIQFTGTGVVKVIITDNDYCIPTELILEVVDAVNTTGATSATESNVVLLNDIGSGFTVSGDYTFYGNGFTLNYTGNGQYLNNGLKQGIVTVSENGTLDNLRIKASIYPAAYMYYGATSLGEYVQGGPSSVEGDKTRYHYQLSSIVAKGNATISNCYVYGGRTNIFVDTGNVTIKDSVLECAPVANIQIQSTNEYTVTLEDTTTIQYQTKSTIGDTSKTMLGAGVIVGPDTTSNPTIVLNGNFKQYNWVTQDDYNVVTNETAKMIIDGALNATEFNHTINGKVASNLGIIYMNEEKVNIVDKTGLPYAEGTVSMEYMLSTVTGKVYTIKGATEDQIYSNYEDADRTTVNGDYLPTFELVLGDQEDPDSGNGDNRYIYGDKNGITALYQDGNDPIALDLTKIAVVNKYTENPYSITAVCKNSAGDVLATNSTVTLSINGSYTLVFTVQDSVFYNANGEAVAKTVPIEFTVPLTLTVKEAAIKDAVVNITKTSLGGEYNTVNLTDYELRIKFLDAISVTDYDNAGTGTTVNLSSNIASATLTPSSVNVFTTASTITITYTDGRVLTVNLSKISGSSPGTKTAKVNTSGSVYFTTEGALNDKPTEASSQNKCTITSVSFKGTNGATITNDTDVTVTWELGSSGGSNPCVTPDTLITLADGSQVRVDALSGNEELLVWNHNTGTLNAVPVAYIVDHNGEVSEREITHLYFSDGSDLKIIGEHVFYDATLNKYVTLDENALDYIGHTFIGLSDDNAALSSVQLVDVVTEHEETATYEVVSYKHLTCFTNGILSASAYMDKLLNIFDIMPETMAYDPEKVQSDIETYGLYTYADFEGLIDEAAFDLYNAKYLKIAVGKGYITWEDILDLIDIYFNVGVTPLQ